MLRRLRVWFRQRAIKHLDRDKARRRSFETIPWEEFRGLILDEYEGRF
jgi:hypothetical protein